MNCYFDTGVLLKLYTAEAEAPSVQRFVLQRAEALRITDLHHVECVSALRLKQFRGECTPDEATRALELVTDDLRTGVLQMVAVEWNLVLKQASKSR